MRQPVSLTILIAAFFLMLFLVWDRSAQKQPENKILIPAVQKQMFCESVIVDRGDYLELGHICYNSEWGWDKINTHFLSDEKYNETVVPVKDSIRTLAIETGKYNYEHDNNGWGLR